MSENPRILKESPELVCERCKTNIGLKRSDILNCLIDKDCHCPACDALIFSCCPEIRGVTTTPTTTTYPTYPNPPLYESAKNVSAGNGQVYGRTASGGVSCHESDYYCCDQ